MVEDTTRSSTVLFILNDTVVLVRLAITQCFVLMMIVFVRLNRCRRPLSIALIFVLLFNFVDPSID